MDGKMLGKINAIDMYTEYGHLYLQVEFTGEGWGTGNTYPMIAGPSAKPGWEDNRFPLVQYMQDAKVDKLHKMIGKPVEVEFERSILKSWRILKEVL